jgi:hypothetical protein
MHIDNLFKRAVETDKPKDQPNAFHDELHPLTFRPQDDTASVELVRGELGRIEQAQGGPQAANRMSVPDPPRDFQSPNAVVTVDPTDGTPILHPYAGQARLRDYPGGKGTPEQVAEARKIFAHMPGPAAPLFELFDKTYNSRVGENHTPGALKLSDAPAFGPDAQYQLHFDVDMYVREDHGPGMNARDMRPVNDVAPASGKRADEFYAVVSDKDNKPLDVLEYDDPGTGSRYLGQHMFNYRQNPDGTSVTSVLHFIPSWLAQSQGLDGKDRPIAGKPNVLAGVTKYYYDSAHHCVQAEFYSGANIKDSPQPAPTQTMKFVDGRVDGTITERERASKFEFFDLLGPRIPDEPGN